MPGEPYSLKLKPNAEPGHERPFPAQKHLKLIKDEVSPLLIELGNLSKLMIPNGQQSPWVSQIGLHHSLCVRLNRSKQTWCESTLAKNSRNNSYNQIVYLLNKSWYEYGLWDHFHVSLIAENLHYYPTIRQIFIHLPSYRTGSTTRC